MDKKHFHWGWIPLLGLLVLPVLWLCLALTTQNDAFVGFQNYMRLFLKDDLFLVALCNTCLPPLMAGALVAAVALTVKKCVWDGQNRPHSQGWFYGVTSVVMGLAMLAVQQSSALIAQLVGYPSADYAAHTLMQHLMDYSSAPHTGMSGTGGIVLWFIAILLLLLVYIADRVIPARKQPAVTGFGRGFSIAQPVFLLWTGIVFVIVNIGVCMRLLALEANTTFWARLKDSSTVWMLLSFVLLILAELVLWFVAMRRRTKPLLIALPVFSAVVSLLTAVLHPRIAEVVAMGVCSFLQDAFSVDWVTELPRGCFYLLDHRLFHLLALLCCVTAVWLRWPREKSLHVSDEILDKNDSIC